MATCGLLSNGIDRLKQVCLDRENNKNFALPVHGYIARSQLHGENIFDKEWGNGGLLSPDEEAGAVTQDKDVTQYEASVAERLTKMTHLQSK